LKKLVAIMLAFGCGVVLAAAVDRIYTTPNPSAELKRLFPAAAAFSPLAGEPLHFKAYAADPKTNPAEKLIGIAFWTTVVTYDSEPYGYFSVEPPKFAAQFKGKRISDPFRVGGDVDAVSRASITIGSAARAIRDSSRIIAKELLPPAVSKE
jgi:hypothetical protein